jgi:hypothetical protein
MLLLALCALLITLDACTNACFRRRHLKADDAMPLACTSITYDCKGTNVQTLDKVDFTNKDQMKNLVAYYCCALREDSDDLLEQRAYEFARLCSSTKVIRQQKSLPADYEMSMAQVAFSEYCPNTWSSSMFKIASYAPLWLVSKLRAQPRTGMLRCNKAHPKTGKSVKIFIDDSYDNTGDLKHVIVEAEGKRYGWSNDKNTPMDDFSLLTGVKGRFHTNYKLSNDAIEWEVHDFDLAKFYDAIDDFETVGKYSLMDQNCAQVALKIIAAGLHCDARAIPFVPPVALIPVFNKVVGGAYWQQK